MSIVLTETQRKYRDIAREFAQKELLPGVLERDKSEEFSMELYKKLGDLGLMGLQFDKECCGQGADFKSFILAVEELCKVDSSFGIGFAISHTATTGIFLTGTKEQIMHCAPRLFSGEAMACFALTEPDAGSDAGSAKTTAVRDGNGHFILNGTKKFITNAPLADYCMLVANTDPAKGSKGLTAFLVDLKTTPGISIGHIEEKCGIRSAKVAEIIIENAVINEDQMLGEEGKGLRYALTALNYGRLSVAAQGLALAEAAFETTVAYMKERVQFGKPIYKNQYLAYKMADLQTEIDMARLLLYSGVDDVLEGRDFSVSACKAKLFCTNLAMKVTTECIQSMGGRGYMRERHVERMFRDAKITQIYEGTNEVQRLIISNSIFR